jgi:methyl-accepting chemotaxis protein
LLGLAGTAAALMGDQPAAVRCIVAVTLSGWGLFTGFKAFRARQAADVAARDYLQSRARFAEQLAPVWGGQIEASRVQMESAIGALATRFAAIVERLHDTFGSAAAAADDRGARQLQAAFERSEVELKAVTDTLRQVMQGKDVMIGKVRQLEGFIAELQSMADAVKRIAAQTSLLALNAAIESARAGPEGRSFSVLAKEVRALSALSGDTGARIAQRVAAINETIVGARQAAEASAAQDEAATHQSGQTIDQVLADLRVATAAITDAAAAQCAEGHAVKGEINEALVQLQFQDRVSQIMSHVKSNIELLPGAMAAGPAGPAPHARPRSPAPLDASPLLAALESTYAMAEERALHHGSTTEAHSPATSAAPVTAGAVEEITFF